MWWQVGGGGGREDGQVSSRSSGLGWAVFMVGEYWWLGDGGWTTFCGRIGSSLGGTW